MGLPSVGLPELVIILAIALLVVGPGRLPGMGQAIGKTIREFRKASTDITDSVSAEADAATPAAPQPNTLSGAAAPNTTAAPEPAAAAVPAPAAPAPAAEASVVDSQASPAAATTADPAPAAADAAAASPAAAIPTEPAPAEEQKAQSAESA